MDFKYLRTEDKDITTEIKQQVIKANERKVKEMKVKETAKLISRDVSS
jgi:hypothetical protein